MANNIGVLKEGVLVEQATPKDLFCKPQHDYTKMLLAAAPNLQNN
jgi:ABC-type dipeptide/oligopeptide/nickel transport system ATPase component